MARNPTRPTGFRVRGRKRSVCAPPLPGNLHRSLQRSMREGIPLARSIRSGASDSSKWHERGLGPAAFPTGFLPQRGRRPRDGQDHALARSPAAPTSNRIADCGRVDPENPHASGTSSERTAPKSPILRLDRKGRRASSCALVRAQRGRARQTDAPSTARRPYAAPRECGREAWVPREVRVGHSAPGRPASAPPPLAPRTVGAEPLGKPRERATLRVGRPFAVNDLDSSA